MAEYRPILTPLAQFYVGQKEKKQEADRRAEQERYNRALAIEARNRAEQERQRRQAIEDERLIRERQQYEQAQADRQYELSARQPASQIQTAYEQQARQNAIKLGQQEEANKFYAEDLAMERSMNKLKSEEGKLRLRKLKETLDSEGVFRQMGLAPEQEQAATIFATSLSENDISPENMGRILNNPQLVQMFGQGLAAVMGAVNKIKSIKAKEQANMALQERRDNAKALKERLDRELKEKQLQEKTAQKTTGETKKGQILNNYVDLLKKLSDIDPESESAKAMSRAVEALERDYPWLTSGGKTTSKSQEQPNGNVFLNLLNTRQQKTAQQQQALKQQQFLEQQNRQAREQATQMYASPSYQM